jgi:hypothetical protein
MNQQNLHIIRQLKMQPRLGMPKTPDPNDALSGLNNILSSIDSQSAQTARGLQAVVGGMQQMVELVREATKDLLVFEDRNKDLADALGMTINNATRFGGVLDAQAKSFGVGGAKLRSYAKNLQGLIGNFATMNRLIETDYGKKLYNTQKIIQSTLKLSGEQANKYTQYVAGIGKDLEEQLALQFQIGKALDDATGTTGNFREIVAEISNLTEDLQMQYGRIPGRLELGVAKAKALGLAMDDLNNAGKDLLDIESSIGQELEYQLISGRRLTDQSGKSLTNAYREATLQGDASKQADLMNQILEQEGDTLKNNLFARQQMSTLLGMDEAALARALQKKSILESLPGGEALFDQTGEELMQAAKAMGATEEQLQELEAAEDRRTTDEKISDLFDIMTSTGISAIVKNPADLQASLASTALGAAAGGVSVVSPLANQGMVDVAGAAVSIKTGADIFADSVTLFKDIITGKGTMAQFVPEQVVATTGVTKFAEGGVVPGGYPNDTYPALLTSGETVTPAGGFDQFAAAIVAAINKQTTALTSNKFGGGLNAPYYG